MSWKLYRQKFQERKINEAQFVLGVDLGNQSSSIASFDANRGVPETIDISGGYGKPSQPTALQYIRETKEWVFGEYAVLNRGLSSDGDAVFTSLLDKLARKEYIDVDGRPQSAEYVMGLYLKELVGYCRSLNPKAEIAGITLAVHSYLTEEMKKSLESVFKYAGLEKALIELVPDRECVFSYYFHNRPVTRENVVLLDFGARELRGGIYEICPDDGEPFKIISISSLFDKKCGTEHIDKGVTDMLTEFYCTETKTPFERIEKRAKEQIQSFAYEHKDLLFQKNTAHKPVKLYFNFVYPPLVQTVTAEKLEEFIDPYATSFNTFLQKLFAKSLFAGDSEAAAQSPDDIDTVICTGGGFEMLWARRTVEHFFPNSGICFYKNSKCVVAEGASVRSAEKLGVIDARQFYIEDMHKLKVDVGVCVKRGESDTAGKFYPIVERSSFWWQSHEPVSFILSEPSGEASCLSVFSRAEHAEPVRLGDISLSGLPPRPAGTTRLKLSLEFRAHNLLTATVTDLGFGELFPARGFSRKAEFKI